MCAEFIKMAGKSVVSIKKTTFKNVVVETGMIFIQIKCVFTVIFNFIITRI